MSNYSSDFQYYHSGDNSFERLKSEELAPS